jgi:hypothetical protein
MVDNVKENDLFEWKQVSYTCCLYLLKYYLLKEKTFKDA